MICFLFLASNIFFAYHVLFVGNLTHNIYNNMRREAAAAQIQKHVHRYKAQKAQKHVHCGYKSTCANRKLKKWAIEYEELVAEAFPLSMKILLVRVSSC